MTLSLIECKRYISNKGMVIKDVITCSIKRNYSAVCFSCAI